MLTPQQERMIGYPGVGCCEERVRLLLDKWNLSKMVGELSRQLEAATDARLTRQALATENIGDATDSNPRGGPSA
jgi:hypothetical protein